MRTRKTVIVLLSGKAFSGKTTTKLRLLNKLSVYPDLRLKTASFASAVKDIATFMGWNGEKDAAGRALLQGIGKLGRAYKKSVWVAKFISAIENNDELFPPNFVFVDDWRFEDEYTFLVSNPMFDVFSVRLTGRGGIPDQELASDESETGLDSRTEFDYVLDNSGSFDELDAKCDSLVELLKQKYIKE